MVLEAILTSRLPREKEHCLFENVMSNKLRNGFSEKKYINCKVKLHSKGSYRQILGAVTVLKFFQRLA